MRPFRKFRADSSKRIHIIGGWGIIPGNSNFGVQIVENPESGFGDCRFQTLFDCTNYEFKVWPIIDQLRIRFNEEELPFFMTIRKQEQHLLKIQAFLNTISPHFVGINYDEPDIDDAIILFVLVII